MSASNKAVPIRTAVAPSMTAGLKSPEVIERLEALLEAGDRDRAAEYLAESLHALADGQVGLRCDLGLREFDEVVIATGADYRKFLLNFTQLFFPAGQFSFGNFAATI